MRYRKTIGTVALLVLAMTTLSALALAAPPEADNGQIYVVQADDWLGTLADKFYGTPLAYPVIIEATNARAGQDGKYTSIDNPHKISVGQVLFIPALDEVPDALLAQAPLEKSVMPADVIVNHTGPTAAQRDLLASLAVVGQPPELFNEVWLNSEPLKLAELHGKVVIIEFWTFG
jgi:hypothetical protein